MSESEAAKNVPESSEAPQEATELSVEQLEGVQGGRMGLPAAAKVKPVVGVPAGAIPSGDLGLL
jgi:hypothetical protein